MFGCCQYDYPLHVKKISLCDCWYNCCKVFENYDFWTNASYLILPIIKLFAAIAAAADDDNDGDGDGDVFHYTLWAPKISFEDNDDNHDSQHFVSTQN